MSVDNLLNLVARAGAMEHGAVRPRAVSGDIVGYGAAVCGGGEWSEL